MINPKLYRSSLILLSMDKTSKREWVKNINLTIADDAMEVSLKIRKGPDALLPTPEELKEYIKSYGINFGLDDEAINLCVRPMQTNAIETYVVARGIPRIMPEPGRIEYLINFSDSGKPRLHQDGSVDQKNLNLMINVNKNDPLARKYPGKSGKAGRTVRGDVLSIPDVKGVTMPMGVKTRISDTDPNLLVAAVTGNVVRMGDYINICEEHVIRSDIDFSTGNVQYPGSLTIKGSIRAGFTVRTGGHLRVEGDIEDATVDCGGDLIVTGGIIGKMKHLIRVHGNVEARYVNGHHIRALGTIAIQDESLNAKLESGEDIYFWKKGVLSGGETYCFNRLDVKCLGSESGNYTDVYFGFDAVLVSRVNEIKAEREEIGKKNSDLRKGVFSQIKTIILQGREPSTQELKEIELKKEDLTASYEFLEKLEQEEDYLATKRKKSDSPVVTVREWVYPGVKLAATTTTHYIREKRKVLGTFIVIGPEVVLSKLIE